jgi:hypothetical protein
MQLMLRRPHYFSIRNREEKTVAVKAAQAANGRG